MTGPASPTPGSTVATVPAKPGAMERLENRLFENAVTFEDRSNAFKTLEAVQRQKLLRDAATAVAAISWGTALSEKSRADVVLYAFKAGVDPVRHIDILGGKIYINAQCHIEWLARDPNYLGNEPQYVHADARADEAEKKKRLDLRVKYSIKDEIPCACVVGIKMRNPDTGEVVWHFGWGWAGSYGNKKDPVGDGEPSKTAFTRAFRRAAKHVVPLWFRNHPMASEEGVEITQIQKDVEANIRQGREIEKAHPAALPAAKVDVGGGATVSAGSGGAVRVPSDGYDEDAPPESRRDAGDAIAESLSPATAEAVQQEGKTMATGTPTNDLDGIKDQLREVLKHECFTDLDRASMERLIGKPDVTKLRLEDWLKSHKASAASWDQGNR